MIFVRVPVSAYYIKVTHVLRTVAHFLKICYDSINLQVVS